MARMKLFGMVLLPLSGAVTYALYAAAQGNFHQITEGEAYRSAQLDGDELEECINNYHIKSILNLRGKAADEKWYAEEMKVSAKHGVTHYDLFLSAYSQPTPEMTRALMALLKAAPRPILIHCQAGADRSGLVAAMWKVIVDRESKMAAASQLSILYGHLPIGPASAMDRFFENWRPEATNDLPATAYAEN